MKKLFLLFCLVALTLGIKAQNQVTLRDVSNRGIDYRFVL